MQAAQMHEKMSDPDMMQSTASAKLSMGMPIKSCFAELSCLHLPYDVAAGCTVQSCNQSLLLLLQCFAGALQLCGCYICVRGPSLFNLAAAYLS